MYRVMDSDEESGVIGRVMKQVRETEVDKLQQAVQARDEQIRDLKEEVDTCYKVILLLSRKLNGEKDTWTFTFVKLNKCKRFIYELSQLVYVSA